MLFEACYQTLGGDAKTAKIKFNIGTVQSKYVTEIISADNVFNFRHHNRKDYDRCGAKLTCFN